jgi:hypothetical protein
MSPLLAALLLAASYVAEAGAWLLGIKGWA